LLTLAVAIFSTQQAPFFAGGRPINLATFLSGYYGRATYIGSFSKVASFHIVQQESTEDLSKLNKLTGLANNSGGEEGTKEVVLRPLAWPVYYPNRPGMTDLAKALPSQNLNDLSVADGLVSLKGSKAASFDISELSQLKFSGPLTTHWFYAKFKVAVSLPQPVSEVAFLGGIARAVGGKLTKRGPRFLIELDPKIFRDQWMAYYENHNNEPGTPTLNQLNKDMRKSFIGLLNDKAIVTVMSSPENAIYVPIPKDSRAEGLAKEFLKAYGLEHVNRDPDSIRSEMAVRHEMLGYIDWDKPFFFNVRPLGFVTLQCQGKAVKWVQF
jgi:hypothetical protein